MHIRIITVGKAHDDKISQAIDEYQKRLSKHVKLEWLIIPSSNKAQESGLILKALNGSYVVLLDETGKQFKTTEFANKIEELQNASTKQITFVIGGAFGVTDDVIARADLVWSLSPLVFPHQIVRLILVEQLYRSYDFLHGGNYHHA